MPADKSRANQCYLTFNVSKHRLCLVNADNRGAKALRALLAGTSQVELARRTGISQSHLSRLSRAETTPKLREQAIALADEGIAVEWWDEPVANESADAEQHAKRRNPTGTDL
jgi:transcriptional regulator with XRE-family HTH domain